VVGGAPYDADDLDWFAGMDPVNVTEFGWALAGEGTLAPEPQRQAQESLDLEAAQQPPEHATTPTQPPALTRHFARFAVANFQNGTNSRPLGPGKTLPATRQTTTTASNGRRGSMAPLPHAEHRNGSHDQDRAAGPALARAAAGARGLPQTATPADRTRVPGS